MKCKIPEISWHNRDPVLSVDIQPKTECQVNNSNNGVEVYRLASGGTDSHVLIWYLNLNTETGNLDMDLAADLTRHQRAVNVVKWSPNGQLLASGDDESAIFIWKQKSDSETLNIMENTNDEDKEIWLTMKILRGHVEDVYDLCWAPNSQLLVSGSVDNTAMIWDVHKGKSITILNDHKGFVQGVAWDPKNQYIATLSTDRYLRIFDISTRKVLHRINKTVMPVPKEHELHEKPCRLYHDDTLQTFFRRLSFTPDGKLLITPSGVADYEGVTHPLHTSYIFSRHAFKQPAIVLPSPEQYTVAVGCCPLLFQLRPHGEENPPIVPLPYRMIFAVATRCSVYFYDTQQHPPFAVISNIHYTRLTDITWSPDGRIVVVSSTDGFCSLITFDEGELGEEYEETVANLLEREPVLQNNNNNIKKKANNKSNRSTNEQKQKMKEEEQERKKDSMNIETPEPILDKEILSSANKFNTPAKKTLNATPIAIRRHPRPSNEFATTKEEQKSIASNFRGNSQNKPIIIDLDEVEDDIELDTSDEQRDEDKKVSKTDKNEANEVTKVLPVETSNNNEENKDPIQDVERSNKMEEVIETKEKQKSELLEKYEVSSSKIEENKKKPDLNKGLVEGDGKQNKAKEKLQESELEVGSMDVDDVKKENETKVEMKGPEENEVNKLKKIENIIEGKKEKENEINDNEDEIEINEIEHKQLCTDNSDTNSPILRNNYLSPSERTPRRVALRTISTPKSKKKLLD